MRRGSHLNTRGLLIRRVQLGQAELGSISRSATNDHIKPVILSDAARSENEFLFSFVVPVLHYAASIESALNTIEKTHNDKKYCSAYLYRW